MSQFRLSKKILLKNKGNSCMENILNKKITGNSKIGDIKISTLIVMTVSLLVTAATLGVAIYAMFFVNSMFSYLVPQDDLYSKLMMWKIMYVWGLRHFIPMKKAYRSVCRPLQSGRPLQPGRRTQLQSVQWQ